VALLRRWRPFLVRAARGGGAARAGGVRGPSGPAGLPPPSFPARLSRLCPPGTWSTVSLHEPGVRLDDLQGTLQFLLSYASSADATSAPPGSPALPARTPAAQEPSEAFEPAGSESGAVRPVVGISQRVKTRPSEKKDLGTLGYVLGIIMVVVLIGIGVGIVLGYLYKRQVVGNSSP
uniref:Phosphoinositide-3-kinase interacting protein 1 n=1 Tax=Naja naja TaxID=35670 RepID=A0A8C7E6G7_NAJNA